MQSVKQPAAVVSPAMGHCGTCPPRLSTISFLVHFAKSADADVNNSQLFRSVQGFHNILVVKFKDFSRTFKDPEVAFSRTNSWWKFTAWTVLQRYLISVSVITGQFQLTKTKH